MAGIRSDPRFDVARYTVTEAAVNLGMPVATLRRWTDGRGLVHALPGSSPHGPTLPFIAMAEAQFYRQLRREGLSMQAIAAGMASVRRELGDQMLVRGRLAHDGSNVLMDVSDAQDPAGWVRARDMQGGLEGVIERGLQPISWAEDELPQRVRLMAYQGAEVVIDPRFVFGQPFVADRGVRAADIFQMFEAGDSVDDVAAEYGVGTAVVEAIVRVRAA